MTVDPALYPGLILGVVALAVWWWLAGLDKVRAWNTRQTLLAKGYCPDCAMPWSHCTCMDGRL